MANVTEYSVAFFGGEAGRDGLRARIQLAAQTATLGLINFYEAGTPIPADGEHGDKIVMHLPITMLGAVVDILRNEKPIVYFLTEQGAVLTTSAEPVGEEEGSMGILRDEG